MMKVQQPGFVNREHLKVNKFLGRIRKRFIKITSKQELMVTKRKKYINSFRSLTFIDYMQL